MIRLPNGNLLVERLGELPDLRGCTELFMDFETAKSNPKRKKGVFPYQGDRIAGVALTVDKIAEAYYLPIRHTALMANNLEIKPTLSLISEILNSCKVWVNHHVKMDAHFAVCDGIEISQSVVLADTLPISKLKDSDRMSYGLKSLASDPNWLNRPRTSLDRVKAFLKSIRSTNYADLPTDLAAEYATDDVQDNRALWWHLQDQLPEQVHGVLATETKLTSVLFDIERYGMLVDPKQLVLEKVRTMRSLVQYADKLQRVTGFEINPKSSPDVYDYLINQRSLPVLKWNLKKDKETGVVKQGGPSFDKKALKLYAAHPQVIYSKELSTAVSLISRYREEYQYLSLFVNPYLELHADGLLHPSYTQAVRTGRMACKQPNSQQLNKRAKLLILCRVGRAFLSCDYSQIEYRIIVHYVEDGDAIRAYVEDPHTDFHTWVAELIGVKRRVGKTLNFGMGFGMGKAKLVASLMADPDIIAEITKLVDADIQAGLVKAEDRMTEFADRCEARAVEIYNTYHDNLPNLKRVSHQAAKAARVRGYVFNAYGRRRHLPKKVAHKGFNSVVQSSAADVMKERTVFLAPRFNEFIRKHDIHIVASVHDETLFEGPIEVMKNPEVRRYIKQAMEDTAVKFRVPIITGMGYSARNWAEACGDDVVIEGDLSGKFISLAGDIVTIETKDKKQVSGRFVGGPVPEFC